MRNIFKYKIESRNGFLPARITTGGDPNVLSAGVQGVSMFLWIDVDCESTDYVTIQVVPTGEFTPLKSEYISTVFMDDMVFHVYNLETNRS